MQGGQGGPRFPAFGVGRGFAIWGPFPVQAPDRAPETYTSLNKNLALHPALPVDDGWGGFALLHPRPLWLPQKPALAPACMILVISWEARPRAGAIKATQATPATDLMVFPAVSDHNRPLVRLAFICRPRLGAQVKRIGSSLATAPPLGLAPPGYEIPPLRGWQKPLQDPTPVERGRTVISNGGRFQTCLLRHGSTRVTAQGWLGRRPRGVTPDPRLAARLAARWLYPARPQPPRSCHRRDLEIEPCRLCQPFLPD